MTAKFQVDAIFSIEGRGTVLLGTIVSGEIVAGMRFTVPGTRSQRRVHAIEFIHGSRIPRGSLGLVLDESRPDDVREFTASVQGKVLDIT